MPHTANHPLTGDEGVEQGEEEVPAKQTTCKPHRLSPSIASKDHRSRFILVLLFCSLLTFGEKCA